MPVEDRARPGRVWAAVRGPLVGALPELREVLERHRADVASPVTLDLIGHSTRHHHLLRLGHTSIDMLDRGVARYFLR